jgi:predicted DNA-binding transcriptional regulator AlpA
MESTPYQLMRPKQAAKHFCIGVSTYLLWVKSRPNFPQPIKAGPGVTLVDVTAIEQYLRSQSAAA